MFSEDMNYSELMDEIKFLKKENDELRNMINDIKLSQEEIESNLSQMKSIHERQEELIGNISENQKELISIQKDNTLKILATQYELNSYLNELTLNIIEYKNENQKTLHQYETTINEILEKVNQVITNQSQFNLSLNDSTLMKIQHNRLVENKLLNIVDNKLFEIEKISSYSNLKLDSNYDKHQVFLEDKFNSINARGDNGLDDMEVDEEARNERLNYKVK